MSTAAILANPASGKDIRRLVAHGSVFDNQEKVRIVRRLILGLEQAGVDRILYMPDGYGIVPRALNAISPSIPVLPVEMPMRNTQQDTVVAAGIMETLGVDVMVVLGGDGTSRAVCKGTTRVPLMPLSTGTNNVFPFMVEATVAGLAAGLVASGRLPREMACRQSCIFDILLDGEPVDVALVDAAVYSDVFMASRAVWDMEKVPQLFLTRCRADAIGLSAVGGALRHIEPDTPHGLALDLSQDASMRVHATIAPGMLADVGVSMVRDMHPGDVFPVDLSPCIIAVDGEREVEVHRGQRASVRLRTDGPWVVSVSQAMELAREYGVFVENAKN
ncbi:ATP-NAD kinase [Paucidesulfovibrio gracilis DSM 16080]|uniref:ATP-NAD kinase n=1 Tax=Paucidesulfovibrio gracilis DSM 16080 TaxID=1121449 RepID=A0A1T4XCK6_9BACT|nr:NAD(+)/NADH kinase [Paucidesulfovibrio gracilis]SKA87273.1 ATP-NAD kinase [Paucidesulfovibrio gracilis DSM 16080]